MKGDAAVIKMFDSRQPEEVEAFKAELANYTRLSSLQGDVLPKLLQHGLLDFTGAAFLALSDEGEDLSTSGAVLDEALRSGMCGALDELHQQGACHGDVRLQNFVIRV